MSDALLVNHCRLITNDLDEARDYVGRLWERHESHLRRGRKYGIKWHQASLAHTSLSYVENLSALHVHCGPVSNVFRFTMHESGRVQRFTNGRESVSTPLRAALQTPGQELRLEMEPCRLLILTLDGNIVAKALAPRFTRGLPVEDWPTEFPIQLPPVGLLQSLTRWMARELDRPGREPPCSTRSARLRAWNARCWRYSSSVWRRTCLRPIRHPASWPAASSSDLNSGSIITWPNRSVWRTWPELRMSVYAPCKMPFAACEVARRRRRSLAAGWTMRGARSAKRLLGRQ
jgi:hypothetical protein